MFKLNKIARNIFYCTGIQPMVITWVQMTEKKSSLNLKEILLIIKT